MVATDEAPTGQGANRSARAAEHAAMMDAFLKEDEDTAALGRIYADLAELGLEKYALELDTFGYTVVPPQIAAPAGFADTVREVLLSVAERRTSVKADLITGSTHRDLPSRGADVPYLLYEDRVFEEVLMNRVQLALVTYLLGEHCVLSLMDASLKGPAQDESADLRLHSDWHGPAPYPLYAQVANATWALTDYTVENGCLIMVPGSHRKCRLPVGLEGADMTVPVETPAGSLIVWHGNTWHGAVHRTAPGLRLNLLQVFCRPYLTQVEDFKNPPAELISRNGDRFSRLLGDFLCYGSVRQNGPDFSRIAPMLRSFHSLYA
jgi:ectoine hydroxylase-related dioxygenase (phytanoyl-CoA dioxygenase family)